MNFDFETILTLITLATGLIWLADAVFFARRRRERLPSPAAGISPDGGKTPREPWWVDCARSFFPVLLAVLLIRSFLVEPFHIPSGSMVPT
ncbi:MAG: S26 family signal peptidase, partial [Gammaproteobacteria bacterium]